MPQNYISVSAVSSLVMAAGAAHLISLGAIFFAPRHLGWKRELARLPALLRQMCEVYSGYTSGTIIAMGLVSLLLPTELANGSPLACAVCGYIAAFWTVRLWLQFHYDARPHLNATWLRWSYHALTLLFIAFIGLYSWLAWR